MALHRRRHPSTLGFDAFDMAWETSPPGVVYLTLRVRRSVLFALAVAVCLHLALLGWILHKDSMPELPLTGTPSETISARLVQPEAPRPRAEPQPPAVQPAPVPPPPTRQVERPKRDRKPAPVKPQPEVLRAPVPDPAPAPPPPAPTRPKLDDEPTDMASYVNRQRERRQAAEASEGRETAAGIARERVPSADEIAMANIKRNLQSGTSGVFQITRKGVRTASFVFRGWTTDAVNARREYIEVDAGVGGDIERALVKRMIELIRRYYQGNFNWDSRVLGRTVVLSAAPENNAQLEDFLIREFFRSGYSYPP